MPFWTRTDDLQFPVIRSQEDVLRSVPDRPFELDKEEFLHSLRTACRGAAEGPLGMSTEHLDNEEDSNKFFKVAVSFVGADVPRNSCSVASGADDSVAEAQRRSAGHRGWRRGPTSGREDHG